MNNTGLNTTPYQPNYSAPTTDKGAVNIYISGINTPGSNAQQQYYPSPYYYPLPYYAPTNYNQQSAPVAAKTLEQPEPKPQEAKKVDEKKVTPISPELINNLNSLLTQGDKQARIRAVAQVLKLLREDVNTRKNDPKLIGLINTSLHSNQPDEVKTAALVACNNGLIVGNEKTKELLKIISGKKDKYGADSLATSALSLMPTSGQRLNVISE
ncbi:MAG TPA: hypothetical protein P5556_08385 [Candidatus Gastranaerophilales bacterium]|nr:hypothetical protein [Candidatus Gastranaerophilales bacterium]